MFFPSFLVLFLTLAKAELVEPTTEFLEPSEEFQVAVEKEKKRLRSSRRKLPEVRIIGSHSISCFGKCFHAYNSADRCHCDDRCRNNNPADECCRDFQACITGFGRGRGRDRLRNRNRNRWSDNIAYFGLLERIHETEEREVVFNHDCKSSTRGSVSFLTQLSSDIWIDLCGRSSRNWYARIA